MTKDKGEAVNQAADQLVAQWHTRLCMPFPAGPVIPPLGAPDEIPCAMARAKVAAELIKAGFDASSSTDDSAVASKKSVLTGLVHKSLTEWLRWHPEQHAASVPATLCALMKLSNSTTDQRHAFADINDKLKLQTPPTRQAIWSRNLMQLVYQCGCQPWSKKAGVERNNGSVSSVYHEPHGDRVLLVLFFMKQVNSHLALEPTGRGTNKKLKSHLYAHVVHVARRYLKSAEFGPYAATVLAGLPEVVDRMMNETGSPMWRLTHAASQMASKLPLCFNPSTLDFEAGTLGEAINYLLPHGDMAARAHGMSQFARDVCAVLTDPAQWHVLNGSTKGMNKFASDFVSRKGLSASQFRSNVVDGSPMPADFFLQYPMRLKRLKSYFNWMLNTGETSIKTRCSPLELPIDLARPLAGAAA